MKSTIASGGLLTLLLATCANVAERSEPTPPTPAPVPVAAQDAASAATPPKRLPPVGRDGPIQDDASRQRPLSQGADRRGKVARFVVPSDEAAQRPEALQARDSRTAFDGAPPPMRHSEDFSGGRQTCLDCHDQGMRIGERVASPMPHAELTACTQCHIERESWVFPGAAPVETSFEPAARRAPSPRAYDEAPPTIPHTLHMRSRCLSCHGEFGSVGLRVDHHLRAQCTQCHLPAWSELSSSPFFNETR